MSALEQAREYHREYVKLFDEVTDHMLNVGPGIFGYRIAFAKFVGWHLKKNKRKLDRLEQEERARQHDESMEGLL